MRPHQRATNYWSSMLSMCHDLAGNSGTVADRGKSQLKFCNQVTFDSGNPADSGKNHVKFDSYNLADSNSPPVQFDSSTFTATPKDGGYPVYKVHVHNLQWVAALGLPHFLGAWIPVPTNLKLKAWAQLAVTPQQCQVVEFLTLGFLAWFEGPVPDPSTANHTSARAHLADIITEIGHRAMLGPFDHPPFTPWCHLNPLLTHPKKDSTSRKVIMDLCWPLPPAPVSMGAHLRTLTSVCPRR